MKLITTSWDDGHLLDFRLAELLDKYKIPGSFYIPQSNQERMVMSEYQIQELAKNFEIGGHTLHHTRLGPDSDELEREVKGSFEWLQQLLGLAPVSFCFPGGIHKGITSDAIFKYGFQLARSTELLCIQFPASRFPLPTTLQVFEHQKWTYIKHLAKRKRWGNMVQWIFSGSGTSLEKMTDTYLDMISKKGGCFHLWGHSWEIEEFHLWKKLETILKILSARTDFHFVQNRELVGLNNQPAATSHYNTSTHLNIWKK